MNFFKCIKKLGDNQLKEKAMLAYNFYFADTNCSNYPFKYTMDKSEGKVSCGRSFGNLQSKWRSAVMEEEMDEKEFKMPMLENKRDFFIYILSEMQKVKLPSVFISIQHRRMRPKLLWNCLRNAQLTRMIKTTDRMLNLLLRIVVMTQCWHIVPKRTLILCLIWCMKFMKNIKNGLMARVNCL